MIGVDTNIVLRLFDRGEPAQTAAAERLFADATNADGFLLNPIVLVELAWTLDRTYKLDRETIADHLDRILQASEFVVPFVDEAVAAASRYRAGPADFADYFFAEINHALGCTTTVTFDRAAAKDDRFTLLTV